MLLRDSLKCGVNVEGGKQFPEPGEGDADLQDKCGPRKEEEVMDASQS